MSDNIPIDIQIEIIKKVPDAKSLLRFRSVSKQWKSFIDSYKFTNHIEPHRFILRYKEFQYPYNKKYICLMDDNDTLTHQQALDPIVPVLIRDLHGSTVVGSCNGVFCVSGFNNGREMVVLWNPSIRKCVGMIVPHLPNNQPAVVNYGFGVYPVTNDPMIVRIPWVIDPSKQVEVFTLSSSVWNVIPSSNLPRESIRIMSATHVVIDRFIHWAAWEGTFDDNGVSHYKILSFDMITNNFKVTDVPYSLAKQHYWGLTVSKLRESLVLLCFVREKEELSAWMMEHDGVINSFRKLFTFDIHGYGSRTEIYGYRKSGEPIIETKRCFRGPAALEVYSPSSKQFLNLGIYGLRYSFFMGSYMETLLLLDHADCFIYDYILPHEEGAKLVIR